MVENPTANAGDARDVDPIPGLGRSPGVGNDNPLQYSCLENPMDRGAGRLQSMGPQRVRHNQAADIPISGTLKPRFRTSLVV